MGKGQAGLLHAQQLEAAQCAFDHTSCCSLIAGVTLKLRPSATPYAAGLLSFAPSFTIPPGQPSYKVGSRHGMPVCRR